jgi:hypothetical protein
MPSVLLLLLVLLADASRYPAVHPFHEQLELRLAVTAAAAWRQQQQQQQQAAAGSTVSGFVGSGSTQTGTLLMQPPSERNTAAAKHARLGDSSGSSLSAAATQAFTKAGHDASAAAAAADAAAEVIPAVVQQLLDFCWTQIFDQACGHALPLRLALLQYLLVPLLELAPRQQQRAAWYSSRMQQLRMLAEYGHAAAVAAAGDAFEEAWRFGSSCAAYK